MHHEPQKRALFHYETVITWAGFIRSYRQRMLYHSIARLDTSKREIKNGHITLFFFGMETSLLGRSRSWSQSRYFRREPELESESLNICRLRSPAQECPRFKSVFNHKTAFQVKTLRKSFFLQWEADCENTLYDTIDTKLTKILT